nr:T9SS type A sorting domain-containing protein [Bacteroidota bacterium]
LLGSISITAFGKYQATDNLPGFIGDEKMDFRLFRHQDNQTLNLEAVFDDKYPQTGNYKFNGLSAVKTFKLENSMPDGFGVTIFPNPGDGNFRVQFHCISAPVPYEVLTMEGEILVSGFLNPLQNQNLDLTELSKGLYLIRFYGDDYNSVQKVVIK